MILFRNDPLPFSYGKQAAGVLITDCTAKKMFVISSLVGHPKANVGTK
jgi:hypothetical protein